MTYPPPDPRRPPHGNYPNYPNYPGPPGGFGPPPPPPKRRAVLWAAGLGTGALVIVAFLVTAFVAPGFLLSDPDYDVATQATPTSAAAAPSTSTRASVSRPRSPSSTAPAVEIDRGVALTMLQDFLDKVASGDEAQSHAAAAMGCPSYRSRVEAFSIFGQGEKYTYDPAQATQTAAGVAVSITGTMLGRPYAATVTATSEGGKNCVTVAETRR